MDSPLLCYLAQEGSELTNQNFYSEELTVQYLKRKSCGRSSLLLLPAGVRVCMCRNLWRRQPTDG